MKRRDFIKLSLAAGAGVLLPEFTYAEGLDLSKINFSSEVNSANNAQTLLIFLSGGASPLAGNLSNYAEIEAASRYSYEYFSGGPEPTEANACWNIAGGKEMEELIKNGDMTIFRTCYSKVREKNGNKDHAKCTKEIQRGTFGEGEGILTNLARILDAKGVIDKNTRMPFVTLDGDSEFYANPGEPLKDYLRPVGLKYYNGNTDTYQEFYDNSDEASYYQKMKDLAHKNSQNSKIRDTLARQPEMHSFLQEMLEVETPDLGENAYDGYGFVDEVERAVKILLHNPDTKVVTLSPASHQAGWDDHCTAYWPYIYGSRGLFETLKSAMAHIKAEGKEQTINIMVFSEFGRGVNLNTSLGWDHGNLQNFYVLGGKGYFNHKGVVGETVLDKSQKKGVNRLYLKPKEGSYWFEPLSIAATLYKIYGIENPEELTGGYKEVTPLFS